MLLIFFFLNTSFQIVGCGVLSNHCYCNKGRSMDICEIHWSLTCIIVNVTAICFTDSKDSRKLFTMSNNNYFEYRTQYYR